MPSAAIAGPTRGPGGYWWWALWVTVTLVAVFGRPLLPIDETRYAAVAWEMWRDQHWLYPTLEGDFYAQKPPMLFWLTLVGWSVAGVMDWVPRAIVAAMGLLAMVSTARLAQRLWPHESHTPRYVPIAYAMLLIWLLFLPAWYFDIPNALWCVVGFHGVLDVAQRRWGRGAVLLVSACVAGVFTKGPMVLLTVGVVALTAPWWGPRWTAWRAPSIVAAAVLVGAAMGLALLAYAGWLWAAGEQAGRAVWREILDAQLTGRLADEADHASPFWWYLPQLLWMLWPGWIVAASGWRRGSGASALSDDAGTRIVVCSGVLLLLVLSIASGKRAHYLMGWVPLGAAWLAHRLAEMETSGASPGWVGRLAAGIPVAALGAVLLFSGRWAPESWSFDHLRLIGVALIGWAVVMAWPARDRALWHRRLGVGCLALVTLHAFVPWAIGPSYQVQALAERVGAAIRANRPVAWTGGRFHGLLTFYGRLPRSPEVIDAADAAAWLARHPDGWVLLRTASPTPGTGCVPYRAVWVCIVQR